MSGSKAETRRWFDRRARTYEGGVTARWRDPLQRASLQALELFPADRLLDVGCGTGAASRAAAEMGAAVVGVDLSPEMVKEAMTLAGPRENLAFDVADVEHLPFPDGRFTAVLCSNAFHHYPDPAGAVAEMSRVLAPGGRLAIGDATSDLRAARIADRFLRWFEPGHVRLYRSAELGAFVQDAGLDRVQLRKLSDGGFAIVRGVRSRP
jgi:ubiquinone/menaquinone biosynthesis C-methylase UbiE